MADILTAKKEPFTLRNAELYVDEISALPLNISSLEVNGAGASLSVLQEMLRNWKYLSSISMAPGWSWNKALHSMDFASSYGIPAEILSDFSDMMRVLEQTVPVYKFCISISYENAEIGMQALRTAFTVLAWIRWR